MDTFSFPADVSDTQQYKLFGNSVTIPVIKEMAETVLKILKNHVINNINRTLRLATMNRTNSVIKFDLHIHSKKSDYKESDGIVDNSTKENLSVLFQKLNENNVALFQLLITIDLMLIYIKQSAKKLKMSMIYIRMS